MKLPNSRLSTRITIAAIAIVIAGVMAAIFIEDAYLRDAYISEQRTNLERAIHAEQLRLNQAIDNLRQDVLFLSSIPPVSGIMRAAPNHGSDSRYGNTGKVWDERLQQIFSAFSAAHPDYYQIRYIGVADGGRELVRVDNRAGKIEITPSTKLQAKGDLDYFKAALGLREGEVYLSEFNLNRELGVIERPYRPTLRAATPVFTPSGQVFGMVVINMDVSRLLESATSGLPAGVQVYITNMDGEYLLHPDARRSFSFELGGKDKITTDFPSLKTIFDTQTSDYLPLQAVVTRAGSQYLASGRIHFDSSDTARFLLLTYHIPHAMAAQQIIAIPARHILGGFIAMLLLSGIVLLALRRIFAPLERITAAVREITAGNRQIRLAETGGGEIGELVDALNSMLDRLADSGLIERESAFRKSIIETVHDGYMLVDTQGKLLEVNQAYADISGYTVDELVGMHISQLEAEGQPVDEVKAHIAKIIAEGYDVFDTRHRREDGHKIDIEVSTTFMRDTQQFVMFCRDITARKQIEKENLRASDDRFRGTLEQAAVGIAHATLDGQFQQINQRFCKIIGYARDELIHMSYQEITFHDDLGKDIHYMQQLLAGEISTFSTQKRFVRKDRSLVWVNLTFSLLCDAKGASKYTIGVIEDITERKHAEALAQQFGNLLQNSFDEIYIFDACSLHFLLVSEGAEKNMGYSFDELNQLTPLELCPLFTKESFEQLVAPLGSGEQQSLFFETVFRRKNGTAYPVEMRLQFMESDFPVYMAVVQDTTERKYSEHQLHNLSAHLQTVREEEKASVAREIHDNLGSTLTALKMDVYWLADELSTNKEATLLLEHVESMSQLLDNAVAVTRRVITDLRPTILDDLGLQAALEWQAEQFQKRTGVQCWVTCIENEGCKGELDKIQTINLFRIFQESLTNVARHSGASMVEVELHYEDEEVVLTISDNGCGLPEGHTIAKTSYGMLGMRERAEQLGGRFDFYGPPGGGFSITVILPLPTHNQKEEKT